MASVRLTKDLQAVIIRNVRGDFDTVMDGYKVPKDLEDEVDAAALADMATHHAEYRAVTTAAIAAVRKVAETHGGKLKDERGIKSAFADTVYTYASYAVLAVDPESDSGKEVEIYHSTFPFSDLDSEKRTVLNWSPFAKKQGTRDPELVAKLMPSFLQRRALEEARKLAVEYAKNMLAQCNTLAQLLRKWPDAANVVPAEYLNKMEEKVPHAPRVTEEPVAIMSMDDALKSIRLQAEAVKALR